MVFEDYPETCLSCGLLGVIDANVHRRPLQEYNARHRANGELGSSEVIWCLRRMAYPMAEYVQQLGLGVQDGTYSNAINLNTISAGDRREALATVLQKHRQDCKDQGVWTKYEEYFDPKEHQEYWRTMELEKLRQQQAETMAEIVKEQTKIAGEHARTAEAHKATFERADKQATWFQWAFVSLAALALVLALAPLAYPDGLPWLVDHIPGGERRAPTVQPTPATPFEP